MNSYRKGNCYVFMISLVLIIVIVLAFKRYKGSELEIPVSIESFESKSSQIILSQFPKEDEISSTSLRPLESFLQSFERLQKRHNILHQNCLNKTRSTNNSSKNPKWSQLPKYVKSTFLHSEKEKLSFCLPPKTGSSSLYHLFWEITTNNQETPEYLENIKRKKPGYGTAFYDFMSREYGSEKTFGRNDEKAWVLFFGEGGLDDNQMDVFEPLDKFFESPNLSISDVKAVLQRSITQSPRHLKIISVRHPLTRFFSSWNDHMAIRDNQKIGNQWKEFNLTDTDLEQENEKITIYDHTISWKNFVQKIIEHGSDSNKIQHITGHHLPLSTMCEPCLLKFDYIIHLETITEDINFILSKEYSHLDNLKIRNLYEVSKKQDGGKDPYYLLKYYCDLSEELVDGIQRFFVDDFENFGYERFDRAKYC